MLTLVRSLAAQGAVVAVIAFATFDAATHAVLTLDGAQGRVAARSYSTRSPVTPSRHIPEALESSHVTSRCL